MVLFEKIILCSFVLPVFIYAGGAQQKDASSGVVQTRRNVPYNGQYILDQMAAVQREAESKAFVQREAESKAFNVLRDNIFQAIREVGRPRNGHEAWLVRGKVLNLLCQVPLDRLNEIDKNTGQGLVHALTPLCWDKQFFEKLKDSVPSLRFDLQTTMPDRYVGSTPLHSIAGILYAKARYLHRNPEDIVLARDIEGCQETFRFLYINYPEASSCRSVDSQVTPLDLLNRFNMFTKMVNDLEKLAPDAKKN
jgi:hypothetical protein